MTEIGLDIGTRNTPLINLVRKDLLPEGSKYIFIDNIMFNCFCIWYFYKSSRKSSWKNSYNTI